MGRRDFTRPQPLAPGTLGKTQKTSNAVAQYPRKCVITRVFVDQTAMYTIPSFSPGIEFGPAPYVWMGKHKPETVATETEGTGSFENDPNDGQHYEPVRGDEAVVIFVDGDIDGAWIMGRKL